MGVFDNSSGLLFGCDCEGFLKLLLLFEGLELKVFGG